MQNFQKRVWQCKQLARIFKFTMRTPFTLRLKYHRCLSYCIFEIFYFILQIVIAKSGYVLIPTEETNEEMKENLRKKYNIGNMIVPQKYQGTVLNGNKIEKEIVEISGRKINILDV